MRMSAGWIFFARVAAMQLVVHLLAAAGFYLYLVTSIVEYPEAFRGFLWFWVTGALPIILLIPLGFAVPRAAIYQRALEAAFSGSRCPEPEWSVARRQFVTQATYSAGMALLFWSLNIAAGLGILYWQNHESPERLLSAALAGLGVFGPLVAIGVFLASELALRPYWPVFFPDRQPSAAAPGRPSLDSRLLIAFVLAGPTASGMMAAIGYLKGIDILTAPTDQGYGELQAMLGMMALALGGSFVVSAMFKQILAHDILDATRRLSHALERLRQGDRGVRVDVYSRDELGRLAEQLNALAEQLDARSGHGPASQELFAVTREPAASPQGAIAAAQEPIGASQEPTTAMQ